MNSSTAWSPPGWCISKRDPPGDPWCRTMNFPSQQGLHKVRAAPLHKPLAEAQTAYAYASPNELLSFVFSARTSSIHSPLLAYCLSSWPWCILSRLQSNPRLGQFAFDKGTWTRKLAKLCKQCLPHHERPEHRQLCATCSCVTNIFNCSWWPDNYISL